MSGRRILFVDDDEIVRSVAGIALRRAGHSVELCAAAAEAVAALRAAPAGYDMAVLDVRLGRGQDGFSLAVELLALQPALRVMLVSGAVDELQRERARALGLVGVFPKAEALGSLELLLPEAR